MVRRWGVARFVEEERDDRNASQPVEIEMLVPLAAFREKRRA